MAPDDLPGVLVHHRNSAIRIYDETVQYSPEGMG